MPVKAIFIDRYGMLNCCAVVRAAHKEDYLVLDTLNGYHGNSFRSSGEQWADRQSS